MSFSPTSGRLGGDLFYRRAGVAEAADYQRGVLDSFQLIV